MRVIKPSFQIEDHPNDVLRRLEKVGRTCYKSEDHITEESAEAFVRMLLKRGHESVIEHVSITVRVICDRGVSHEIVRHRLASYAQESTRYCNYSKDKFGRELTVIQPLFFDTDSDQYRAWEMAMRDAEMWYFTLLDMGAKPEEARTILPNSIKTEIVMTMNLREWRTFFRQRTSKHAHPQMREIAVPMLEEFKKLVPVIFDDLEVDNE